MPSTADPPARRAARHRARADAALLDKAQLPRPQSNVRVHGHEVDALWPAQRLIVEVDGFAYHRTRAAFEHDRLRDADLHLAGYTVLRVTWDQFTHHPEALVARLAAALAQVKRR